MSHIDPGTCSICLETLKVSNSPATLNNCSHQFCFVCIQTWSRTSNTCPTCKAEFNEITRRKLSTNKRNRDDGDDDNDNEVIKVRRVTQRAEYDVDEINRLGYDFDISDVADEYEDDGFIVDDGDEIEYDTDFEQHNDVEEEAAFSDDDIDANSKQIRPAAKKRRTALDDDDDDDDDDEIEILKVVRAPPPVSASSTRTVKKYDDDNGDYLEILGASYRTRSPRSSVITVGSK